MPHEKDWGSNLPGCLIFLIDQSASMNEEYPSGSQAPGQQLKTAVATQINNTIRALGDKCLKDKVVSPRVEIGIITYGDQSASGAFGGSLAGRDLVSITELMDNPLEIETRKKIQQVVDDAGQFRDVETEVEFPIWYKEHADGGTPMNGAVEHAGQVASDWVKNHPKSHPPIVINITDGVWTDTDPRQMAEYLKQLDTEDGPLLMFNCHMSISEGNEIKYPLPGEDLPQDEWDSALTLFEMSSEVPEKMRNTAAGMGTDIRAGAKGFLFNADLRSFADLIVWASNPGDRDTDA